MVFLSTLLLLFVYGGIATLAGKHILNLFHHRSNLIALKENKYFSFQTFFRLLLSSLTQIFIYLAYVAFIVAWSRHRIDHFDLMRTLVWALAFAAATVPILKIHADVRAEERESSKTTSAPRLKTYSIIETFAFICFFLFACIPQSMSVLYRWIPYV